MNDVTDQKQSISDDQELAKVLAGVGGDSGSSQSDSANPNDIAVVPVPGTPMPGQALPPVDGVAAAPALDIDAAAQQILDDQAALTPPAAGGAVDSGLEAIKKEALGELRPLVDKLQVEADEKFDIYLLLLRSTDDRELIAPAHEAAKAIQDESKRAQALLDIIKEIDFLSQGKT